MLCLYADSLINGPKRMECMSYHGRANHQVYSRKGQAKSPDAAPLPGTLLHSVLICLQVAKFILSYALKIIIRHQFRDYLDCSVACISMADHNDTFLSFAQ